MEFTGIRNLTGLCPVCGEEVERVRLRGPGLAVERYHCPSHGATTYIAGAQRAVMNAELRPNEVPLPLA